ncbi:unnamed protein product [Cuscuta campestris]|uniref:Integrase catalytic domain-containing protein n=1 Tax=Cuscuta campestris TaxID=132261 RepID=A0A484M2W6_9ASTE|nr:unnamed protein product [Cuscuta campestris]
MDGFGFDAHTGNGSSSETPVVNISAGLGGSVGQTTPINIPFGSSAAMGSTPITAFIGSSATMGFAPVTSVIGPTATTAAMVTPLGPNMASAIPVIPSLGPNAGVFTSAPVGHPTVMLPANSVKEPTKFTGVGFKTWQQRILFWLTTLNLARTRRVSHDQSGHNHENRTAFGWNLCMVYYRLHKRQYSSKTSRSTEQPVKKCGKDRGNGNETAKTSDVNVLEVSVVGETVFDAHKSPSLDSKDKLELDAKQLHSNLLPNAYNGEAPSETSSDPQISILPRQDLSQEVLESNQNEEASQRYNIQYPPLPRVLLSPFAAEFIPLMPNPYAALFNHAEVLGKNSSLKDDEFDKIDDGNKVLYNNALEEIREEREGPILYTHSEGEDKAFNDNILKPIQIDYSRMFKTPFDLGRDYKGRHIYSPSQIVTRNHSDQHSFRIECGHGVHSNHRLRWIERDYGVRSGHLGYWTNRGYGRNGHPTRTKYGFGHTGYSLTWTEHGCLHIRTGLTSYCHATCELCQRTGKVHSRAASAKELWTTLSNKYQAEDAGAKKFVVGKDEFRSYLKLKRKEMTLEQLLVRLQIREEGLTREKKVAVAKANVVEHPPKEGSSKGPKPNKDKKKIGPKGGVAKTKFAGKCYNWGITGHRSSECRKKPQKKKQKKEEALCSKLDAMDLCAVVIEVNLVESNPKEWWVDTGATHQRIVLQGQSEKASSWPSKNTRFRFRILNKCGKDRGNGNETAKTSDVNVLEVSVVGETVFDAHKSPSLDSKDKLELDAKQLHSNLLPNAYNGEAPSETSSDPQISILPRQDLSQEPSRKTAQPNFAKAHLAGPRQKTSEERLGSTVHSAPAGSAILGATKAGLLSRGFRRQIEMKPRTAIKAQALADFMVECTARDNNLIPTEEQGEWWTLSTDASSAEKACGGGVVIQSPEGFRSYHAIKFQFRVSNNEAEYEALLSGLRLILNLKAEYVRIRCDSRLVVNQIKGEFDTKEERMRLYKEAAMELLKILKGYELLVSVIIEEASGWIAELIRYKKDGILPGDETTARLIKRRAPTYVIENGRLYKRSYNGTFLRCVDEARAGQIMEEVHEGDCAKRAKRCKVCQIFQIVPGRLRTTYHPISSSIPFAHWGIDLIGLMPRAPGNFRWIIVAVDNFTKWIEAEPLVGGTSEQCSKFVNNNILYRYGVPKQITTDNGTQFEAGDFNELLGDWRIRHTYSSVAYPQGNGQVENANRTIMDGIMKRLESYKGAWVDQLPNVLWAYRTTPRKATGETPFSMCYGQEARAPSEVFIPTWREENYEDKENEETMAADLNFIEERREQAFLRAENYRRQVKEYYDRKVRAREFRVGDLVLRKREASQPTEGGKFAKS